MESYSLLALTLVLFFGLSIGSFLNVLAFRIGSGVGPTGRSKCLSCGKRLTPLMLVPVLSYLFLRGRCGHCDSKISVQYPIVELLTGIVFVAIGAKHGVYSGIPGADDLVVSTLEAALWSVLILILVYDLKHKIIPDRLALLFAVGSGLLLYARGAFGMIAPSYLPFLDGVSSSLDWYAAPIVALPLAAVWLFTGGRGMGLGDAKLAWGVGWFLGLAGSVTAIILSFWIAFFPSVALLFVRSKRFTMKSEIPFAPFIVLAALVTYVFDLSILAWTF